MKNYSKVGNRNGRPGFRTQAAFRYRKHLAITRQKLTAPTKKRA